MELRFSVSIEVPERDGRPVMQRAARQLLLKLASELIRCSVAYDVDEPEPPTTETG